MQKVKFIQTLTMSDMLVRRSNITQHNIVLRCKKNR